MKGGSGVGVKVIPHGCPQCMRSPKMYLARLYSALLLSFKNSSKLCHFQAKSAVRSAESFTELGTKTFFSFERSLNVDYFSIKIFGVPMFTFGARPFVHFCKQIAVYPLRIAPNWT